MLNLTIKNVSESLHKQLKRNAVQHHRSLNGETIVCLENALRATPVDASEFLMRVRALRKKTFVRKLSNKKLNQFKQMGRR